MSGSDISGAAPPPSGTLIGPLTPGYLPYATTTTNLADSPWYRIQADTLGFNATNWFFLGNTTNVLFGRRTANNITATAAGNAGFGDKALNSLTDGTDNTAVGDESLQALTTGNSNTAVGKDAGKLITSGINNTMLGKEAGNNATGDSNTIIGQKAGDDQTTASRNTIGGAQASANNLGSDATSFGYQAGIIATNLSRTVFIGSQPLNAGERVDKDFADTIHIGFKDSSVTNNVQAATNSIYIGSGVIPDESNDIVIGNALQTKAAFAITSNDGSASKYLNAAGTYTAVSGAANWTADGTTNSTLAGEARVHNLVATNKVEVGASGTLGWSDVLLNRGGANILEQRNGVNAQVLRVYNTYTDASNYERLSLIAQGGINPYQILSTAAGTGTARSLDLGVTTTAWRISASGNHLLALTDNTYDIGASGATRPRTIYYGTSVQGSSTGPYLDSASAGVAATGEILWRTRSKFRSSGDGLIALYDAAGTDFSRLQFGGTTASFPALKRSSTELHVRLADDSAFAPLQAGAITSSGAVAATGEVTGSGIRANSGGSIYWNTRSVMQSPSDGVIRVANNAITGFSEFRLGPDTATPANPLIRAASGSGTDIAGGKLTLAGGQSTGTGRGGDVVIQTSPSGATGSSANAYSTRTYKSAKAVALTETTATTIANITCAAAKYIGGTAIITVFASDATDHQARTLRLSFSAVNKAGTVTAAIDTPDESIAASAGTLTATITAVANGNSVDLKVDATSSLTQTTLEASWALEINGSDVATVTAQ